MNKLTSSNNENLPEKLVFELFEAFLFRYVERYFCLDDSGYLYKAFRLFHLLLLYHDPQLAIHLQTNDFPPELYSPSWFLTLYSRSLPIHQVLRLWDMIIAIDDPAYTFFIGLCLLRRLRTSLLLAETDTLPEILNSMNFNGDNDIDNIVVEATSLYKVTPRCFCRCLRLCCVSRVDLAPSPGKSYLQRRDDLTSQNQRELVNHQELDRVMAIQTVRSCVMITAQDLISSLLPITGSSSPGKNQSIGLV